MDVMIGDCKLCKTPQVKIFEHSCWAKIRAESKKQAAKNEVANNPDPGVLPEPPVDDEGKTDS
jgi:hypothetical protein